MKKLVMWCVFAGLLSSTAAAFPAEKDVVGDAIAAAAQKAVQKQNDHVDLLSNQMGRALQAFRQEMASFKQYDKQRVVYGIMGVANAYGSLRRASQEAASAWAVAVGAPVKTGWDGQYVPMTRLLKDNFPYEAYQRSSSYEDYEEFDYNLRLDLSNQIPAAHAVLDRLADFRMYVQRQDGLTVSHVMQAMAPLMDEFEDLYASNPQTAAKLAAEINRPVLAGWGVKLLVKDFARDHCDEIFGDTGVKFETFASHL